MTNVLLRAALITVSVGSAGLVAASCLFPPLDELASCSGGCGGSGTGMGGALTTSTTASTSSGLGGQSSVTTASATSTTTAGATGGASSASSASTGGAEAGVSLCALTATMHGPQGVHIVPGGGFPPFCIDSTEVSVAQYREFFEGNNFPVPVANYPAQCMSWKKPDKTSFKPMGNGYDAGPQDYIWGNFSLVPEEQRPIQGLDWCDAAIFCAWAGKRLCGAENPQNRHIDTSDSSWNTTGEWHRACGGPSGTAYGYGPVAQLGVCNTNNGPMPPVNKDMDPFNTTNVNEPASCVASWPDGPVYNMNGNVQEQEDNCDDGSGATPDQDLCHPRGGVYVFDVAFTSCHFAETNQKSFARSLKSEFTGVRCCW